MSVFRACVSTAHSCLHPLIKLFPHQLSILLPKQELDLCTMTPGDQEFTAAFTLTALPSVSTPTLCSNIVLWFDTAFSARHCTAHPVMLSTSPAGPMTHWAQTVLTLRTPVLLLAQASATAGGAATASVLTGRISMVSRFSVQLSVD